jgi:hypothetical protein
MPNLESDDHPRQRTTATWVRVVVWLAIAFLTMAVISGMFLY